ncbi:MAG: MCP four helix bundle domain-containing protein [Deltaproteobacteria bacterium]|nr:MCP four helix bundle domain-containing protein [Deltaproteobacteria bacterium]
MQLNIGKRLGLAFGVVVVVMVVAGGFALYQLNTSSTAFRDVSEHEMTVALAAFGIRSNFDEMVWATKNILLRGTDREAFSREIETFNYKKNRLETMWQPMLESILAGPDITDEQRKFYDDFKNEYAVFLDAWEQSLPVYQSRGREAADAIMKGKGRMTSDHLIELVRSLRAQALKDMEDAAARTRMVVITMLVAFLVAVLIAVISTFYIARQLATAIEGMTAGGRGKKK